MPRKVRIAHLAGPNATIQNTPPLVTSNKARARHGLPPRQGPDGEPLRHDVLRAQRLAAPVTVYVEQFSAHPLEADAAELYGPPDGYVGPDGAFSPKPRGPEDKPVYAITLDPEDGLIPMPYMALQADGSPWEEECAYPGAPIEKARQPFFPDGSRSFEEIDRLEVGPKGVGSLISSVADVDFFRVLPSAGWTRGDEGTGAPPERRGEDFFPYKPYHIGAAPPRPALARLTNRCQEVLGGDAYDGAIWTQGSPRIEETIYWLNLLLDVRVPICGTAAQRPHGQLSHDGPANIVDAVNFIASRVWADDEGRNTVGHVLVQEQRVFAAREVMKVDARPGGYVATGGHGGVIGASGHDGSPLIRFLPTSRHTWRSELRITVLPETVPGVRREGDRIAGIEVRVKTAPDALVETAIPRVAIVKDGSYLDEDFATEPDRHVDLIAQIADMLDHDPLAGFIVEGVNPYGLMTSMGRNALMLRAVHSGIPVVRVGRGATEGFVPKRDRFIAGSNLTATKARILLMACLLKFGALPPCADPDAPTEAELAAIRARLADYQRIFDTH